MPFKSEMPPSLETILVEIDNEITPAILDEDGNETTRAVPRDPAIAIFADGSKVEFPKGVKFIVDNHTEPNSSRVLQMRMRALVYVEGQAMPKLSLLIPIACSKEHVLNCMKRLQDGV